MKIPDDVKKVWDALRSPADIEELKKMLPGSNGERFRRAFRAGRCKDDVFKVMAQFYKGKASEMQQIIQPGK